MLLSLVVPVYREEKNIPEFLRRVRSILDAITQDYEIVFSMDPSPDRTEEVVLEEREKDPQNLAACSRVASASQWQPSPEWSTHAETRSL